LRKNFDVLESHVLCNNYDIVALSECWILENTFVPSLLNFNNISVSSTSGKSGGVVIYYKKYLNLHVLDHQTDTDSSQLEILIIEIINRKTIFSLAYRHPTGPINSFCSILEDIFNEKHFLRPKINYIFCGDININILDNSNKVRDYKSLIDSFDYKFYTMDATRISSESATCIDHVFGKTHNATEVSVQVKDYCISDHNTIEIKIGNLDCNETKQPIPLRCHSHSNIELFYRALENTDWSKVLKHDDHIDINFQRFLNTVLQFYDTFFPIQFVKKTDKKPSWLSQKLVNMISHKNYLLRKFKRRKKIADKIKFTNYNKTLKKYIYVQKQSFYKSILSDNKLKWQEINKLMHNKKSTNTTCELAPNEFLKTFEDIFSVLPPSKYNSSFTTWRENSAFMHYCHEHEIIKYFALLKDKGTRQLNDIPMFLWRKIGTSIAKPIASLVNQMLATSTFPNLLKHSDIVPLYKKGSPQNPSNYRPVAVLHNLSKIFENSILSRMQSFIEKENILPNNQFGFRKNHSTKDAILSLFLQIENNSSKKNKTCAVFLDLSKAFDCVNHLKLLKILNDIGFRGQSNLLIESFLKGRTFRIKTQNTFSNYSPIVRGVPQGSVLSPLLYSLYVIEMGKIHKSLIQYADDTTLLINYTDINSLQVKVSEVAHNVISYLNSLDLILNESKTNIILFGEKNTRNIKFLNTHIETCKTTKFLGIQISSKRHFDYHITQSIIPNIRKKFTIFSFISKYLHKNVLAHIFKAFIYPHIVYATPFILNSHKTTIQRLSRTYNQAQKILFRLPFLFSSHDLPQKTQIPCLSSLIDKHAFVYAYLIFYEHAPMLTLSYFRKSKRNKFILQGSNDVFSIHNTIASKWNKLPDDIRSIKTKSQFKTSIQKIT